mmetsp:Transcript_22211/g.55008  ORF Transcript_22211/g.55008 Transcript_22211/m.55008 type:complete len:102 (+) Transcript_22211:1315-1620(+)
MKSDVRLSEAWIALAFPVTPLARPRLAIPLGANPCAAPKHNTAIVAAVRKIIVNVLTCVTLLLSPLAEIQRLRAVEFQSVIRNRIVFYSLPVYDGSGCRSL